MNYFQPYSLPADQAILAAWDSQLAELADSPALVTALAKQPELFPRFAAYYTQLRALPRGTRRALQRKLARARELVSLQPEWQRKLAGSLAGAALLLVLAQSASAATITVTTNVPDINDGDGKCSLIEAIINANDDAATHPDCPAGDGADTIVLVNNSTITVTKHIGATLAFVGIPAITGTVTIEANNSKIVRNSSYLFDLIIVGSSGDVTLKDLTLQNGFTGAANAGKLRIENGTIAGSGGGLDSLGFHFRGRGVFNSGSLIISNSAIVGNETHGGADPDFIGVGGGIMNVGVAYIQDSTVTKNSANAGGGIANDYGGTLIFQNSTISGNAVNSIIGRSRRPMGGFGGGILNGFNSYLRIENSTISGNSAEAINRSAAGGGISGSGTIVILNSTISGNTADASGADADGGGIVSGGSIVIVNSTITNNTATASSGHHSSGGGVWTLGTLTLSRSLISGNAATSGPEVYATGNTSADDFNLFGSKSSAGIQGFTPGLTDIVPKKSSKQIIGPLKNNGGTTLTHMLIRGSPAINAAPVDENCPATDQRGRPRPSGSACDIGAIESSGK